MKNAKRQAAISHFQFKELPVESEKDVPQQLRALLPDIEALWLMPDSTVLTNESIGFILESALAQQIPVVGFSRNSHAWERCSAYPSTMVMSVGKPGCSRSAFSMGKN